MKSIRRAYHICTLSFRRWLGDYRILIVFLAVFTYCYMALAPVKEFFAAGNIKINACVPLFLFEFSANKFFLFLFLILLLCDAPFRDRTQQMTILRSGRISWGVGKIFYMAGSCMLYFFSVYMFSWMVLFPYIEFSNQWGKGIMTLAKTDAAARYQIVNVFFSEKIVDYFTPGQAAFFSLLLCFAAALLLGLILFVGNFLSGSLRLGLAAALALVIMDTALFSSEVMSEHPILYGSPVTWCSLSTINIAGFGRTPDITFISRAYTVLLAGLSAGAVLCSARKQLD